MTDYAELLPIAHETVDLARSIMRTMQPGVLTAKGDRDMASEVDYAVEEQVRAFLNERTPDIGLLGEEAGASGDTGKLMWALDPVDGTVNFVHGSPLCAVSLGLITENRSVLGVIDLPFLGNRYSAAEGDGANADGLPLQLSRVTEIHEAVVAIGDYAVGAEAEEKNALRFAMTQRLAAQVQRVRMHGSAAIDLAWLAAGKVDAVVMLSNKAWDTSAGVIIAREAGALIVDLDGTPHTSEAAATIAAAPAYCRQSSTSSAARCLCTAGSAYQRPAVTSRSSPFAAKAEQAAFRDSSCTASFASDRCRTRQASNASTCTPAWSLRRSTSTSRPRSSIRRHPMP